MFNKGINNYDNSSWVGSAYNVSGQLTMFLVNNSLCWQCLQCFCSTILCVGSAYNVWQGWQCLQCVTGLAVLTMSDRVGSAWHVWQGWQCLLFFRRCVLCLIRLYVSVSGLAVLTVSVSGLAVLTLLWIIFIDASIVQMVHKVTLGF